MKTLCIYHKSDHDGKGSAAIVKSIYPDVQFYGLDHLCERPYNYFKGFDRVIICDISLDMEIMFELNEILDLVWIDHHYSSISKYGEYIKKGFKEIKGLRNTLKSSIEQTYNYYYPNKDIPKSIKYLANFDINPYKCEKSKAFEYGFQALGDNEPDDEIWKQVINNEINCINLIEKGEALISWLLIKAKQTCNRICFESEFMGYKCICTNKALGYFEFYDGLENREQYDLFINFYMNKDKKWILSFYTEKDSIDVSKIAREHFDGGGHRKAAGSGALDYLPEFLGNNMVI
jgi:oligoribonuclease NrnB/cAMP/cGMP phosphodiesterase (DHH superfamily)